MHIQIVNFRLKGLTEAEYAAAADQMATAYAAVPGLERKIWLANSETGTYGGVYIWRDKQAMDDYFESELFNTVATHPNLDGITSTDFEVMDAPTAVTNGMIGLTERAMAGHS
jgi:hypothetical protein